MLPRDTLPMSGAGPSPGSTSGGLDYLLERGLQSRNSRFHPLVPSPPWSEVSVNFTEVFWVPVSPTGVACRRRVSDTAYKFVP